MRAVLSKTRRRRILNHATHATIRVGFDDRVPSVVDHVDDNIHLAQTDTVGWERVKVALVVPFFFWKSDSRVSQSERGKEQIQNNKFT